MTLVFLTDSTVVNGFSGKVVVIGNPTERGKIGVD